MSITQGPFFDYNSVFLPVVALQNQGMEHVLRISSVIEAVTIECDTNDLSEAVSFFEEKNGIDNPAEIEPKNGKNQIAISLSFCQFMWAVGLYMTTYFDNIVQIPNMNLARVNSPGYQANPSFVKFAYEQFMRARTLLYGYNHDLFFSIPNICDPQEFNEPIGKANGVFLGSLAFVFCHELSHSILGHTHKDSTPEESVKEEAAADNYAIELLLDASDGFQYTDKVGAATVLCSLLLMGEDSISGGSSHPHMDYRIRTMMTRFALHEMDCLWGYVGSSIRLWLLVYGDLSIQEDMKTSAFDCYKEFYDYYLNELIKVREQRYPSLRTPTWFTEP